MLCPSCNNFRPATNAPCPSCNAPSPLAGNVQGGNAFFSANPWDNGSGNEANNPPGQLPFGSSFWQDSAGGNAPQVPFPQSPQPGNLWMQVMSPSSDQQGGQAMGQALVPYQAPNQGQPANNSLMVLPSAFPTINQNARGVNPLLPALPDAGEAPVYVAPMYTKPRPLIPRYRAVSGLLSVLIVCVLLCAGAGYYAKVTGKLTFIQSMFGSYTPPKIAAAQNMLPVPSNQVTPGPVWNTIVTSAAISNSVDPKTNQVSSYINHFTVGQIVYITCSVNTSKAGTLIVQYYTNDKYYTKTSKPVNANTQATASFPMTFEQPFEGKAEIYWADAQGKNAQLAVTLLFVVQPEA